MANKSADWLKRKEEKLAARRREQEERESMQCTFRPAMATRERSNSSNNNKQQKQHQPPPQQQQQQQQQPQQQEQQLPPGWLQFADERGFTYYFNAVTQQTQWDFPVDVPAPEPQTVSSLKDPLDEEFCGQLDFSSPANANIRY